MTNPRQPYGFGYGAPPPKRNTGMIVANCLIVVAVLAGVGVTGFVAPGFFVSDDEPRTTTTPTTTEQPERTGPEEALETLADALGTADTETLKEWPCPTAESIVDTAIDSVQVFAGVRLVGTEENADEAVGTIESRGGDEFELTITQDDHGEWCWQDLDITGGEPTDTTDPEPSGDGGPTAGGQPVAPDAASVKAQLCQDAITTPAEIDEAFGHEPNLMIDTAMDGIATDPMSIRMYLHGTAGGQEISGHGASLWMVSYDGPWCVHAFGLVVV